MTQKTNLKQRLLRVATLLAALTAVSACNPNSRQSGGQSGDSSGSTIGTTGDSQQPGQQPAATATPGGVSSGK